MSEEITRMPAVALRGMTILPSMIVHFDVSRDKSIKAIEQAMTADQKLFVVTQRDPEASDPGIDDLYHIGTVVEIKQLVKLPKNIIRVLVEGLERAELLEMEASAGYLDAKVATFPDVKDQDYPGKGDEVGQQAMIRNLKELFQKYAQANGKISQELVRQIMEIEDLEHLTDQIAIHIPLYYEEKQRILEAVFLYDRYEELCVILANEENIMRIKVQLQEKVKARIDKNQKEYILREQLKLIREELGDDTTLDDAQHFLEETEKLTAGEEVKEKIRKEIKRFSNSAGNTSEAGVIRGYIETLLEMPWDKMSEDNEDISAARKQLDQDHYGLEKVKERVLEFLAVRTLTRKGDSPILCLVGPPGTGKTSIAKSIAEALNKQYVRICLGGVRDEAEIRGHRRTYVGAMPGRIANGLKMAGVKNPLMLLDEVDKVSSDYKGDTSSALLEVLDPEQNVRFRDHYIEIPVDLSEVLFIATANDVQGIPRPLLDRMELIEIAGYTENEKEHIAKEHLIPKQMEENGIEKGKLTIQSAALKKIINNYTKEAGVRNLERTIGQICRKTARLIMEEDKKKVTVTSKNLSDFLGKEHFNYLMANKKDEIGISRGLAWTQVGGDTLQIEVNVMPGKGELMLTGQLGDVMKESAQAGITYIRSIASDYKVEPEFFQENDIHVHIPEGAVPKDGPSAGITMATAILSAIIKKPVRADLAMTGEITLRGRVLPIGGLKEKLLAAKYAKIKEVLVPAENKPDIQELDKEITDGLTITFVSSMKEVLNKALV